MESTLATEPAPQPPQNLKYFSANAGERCLFLFNDVYRVL